MSVLRQEMEPRRRKASRVSYSEPTFTPVETTPTILPRGQVGVVYEDVGVKLSVTPRAGSRSDTITIARGDGLFANVIQITGRDIASIEATGSGERTRDNGINPVIRFQGDADRVETIGVIIFTVDYGAHVRIAAHANHGSDIFVHEEPPIQSGNVHVLPFTA